MNVTYKDAVMAFNDIRQKSPTSSGTLSAKWWDECPAL